MRRTLTAVACVAGLSACFEISGPDFLSCEPHEPVAQGKIEIFAYGAAVGVGGTLQLTAEVRPLVGGTINIYGTGECHPVYGDPVRTPIKWSSSDDRIATVSATGVVSGRAAGDAVITARAPLRGISSARTIRVSVTGGGGP